MGPFKAKDPGQGTQGPGLKAAPIRDEVLY